MSEIYIHEKSFHVLSETLLASGGNHNVFELSLEEPILINLLPYSNILFRKNKNRNYSESKSLVRIFHELKIRNIPTISFLEKGIYKNEEGVVVENLNNRKQGQIYVSSNYHPQDKLFLQLKASITQGDYAEPDNSSSKEFYLSHNKLKSIMNLQEVNKMIKDFITLCTNNKVYFAEDSIFFGVDLQKQTISDILIGDYDFVRFDKCNEQENNNNAMNIAFEEFKMHFVENA